MTSESRETVKAILERALEVPAAERPSFVARACADDSTLRREVESLLVQEEGHSPWAEGPIVSLFSGNGTKLEPEQRIGPYRIEKMLGEGGMGTVALAVREDDFEKKVALKVIQGGRISEELVRRFHEERQILAHLEHPNIARILDGGTTPEGLPYFVMEYVEGEPIDVYCERRELSLRQRLELFLQVCSALHLAHQNLVVHRDLKPVNILVTGEGVPKLLDFGIAKRMGLESGDELTGPGPGPMTLKYASPEQVDGRSITIGTDVYSLGVLLYQMLTGRYPYAAAVGGSAQELARAIREVAPSAPSAVANDPGLRRRLAGDLDSIVRKAMHKDPAHRYGSVEQLADDIRRYFALRPVAARESTWSYRTGKLVRRHRLPLAAAAVVIALSLAFAVTVTRLWREAVSEREQAVQARDSSERVLTFMKDLFRSSGPNAKRGAELTAFEILERGEREIQEGLDDPLIEAKLLATVGEIYTQLGLYNRARAPWERAVYVLSRSFPDGHPELAIALNNLAGWAYYVGESERAEELYRRALEMKQGFPPDAEIDVGKSTTNLATILMYRGAYEEAEELYLRSLDIHKALYGGDHEAIAITLRSLGVLYDSWGRLDRAELFLRQSLEMRLRLYDPEDTQVATALASLGRVLHAQGRHEEAEAQMLRSLEIRLGRFDEDHPHVASSRLDLARLYLDTGKLVEGEAFLEQSLNALRAKRSADAWEIAEAESVLAGYRIRQGRYPEAEEYLVRSLDRLTQARGERSKYVRDARDRLRELYAAWGRPQQIAGHGAATG